MKPEEGMLFAYADPPYLGCGKLYKGTHPNALDWDNIETHRELIYRLTTYDGWAMSCSTPSLAELLPICNEVADVRVAAWVKPFAVFKPNVNPAYAWEPVIFSGGRKRGREHDTVRDWLSKEITLSKGLTGAKPAAFCRWVLDLLGFDPRLDTIDDLFPGTGIMSEVVAGLSGDIPSEGLFARAALDTQESEG